MKVQMDGAALTMPKAQFLEAYLKHPHLRNLVDRYQATLMMQAQQNAACHALHSVRSRLCRWLLQSQDLIESAKVKGCVGGGDCESQYLHFGEIDDASTGATKSQVFDLPPGQYFLACWQQGTPEGKDNGPTHLSIGMVHVFTVTP